MIGTPFVSKSEIDQRKVNRINKKPWEQEVRDEKGRKRFHGAFTGGFSAGYYNTVGSKEGWKPKANYQPGYKQNVMEYMDEEDITDQVGNQTISNKDTQYSSSSSTHNVKGSDALGLGLGLTVLDKLNIIPKMNQMQQSLMQCAGYSKEYCDNWSNHNGSDGLLSHKKQLSFKFKDDYEGIGYVKGNELKYNTNTSTVANSNNGGNTFSISNSNIMRMNAFEDNEALGFYNERDTSEYNFEEIDVNEGGNRGRYNKNRLSKGNSGFDVIPKFIKSKSNAHLGLDEKEFKMPQVPNDFDFELFDKNRINKDTETIAKDKHPYLNMDKRREMLQIDLEKESKQFNSKFESQADILKNKQAKEISITDTNLTNQIETVFNFKLDIPFKDDMNKISRFARFLAEKEGLTSNDTKKSSNQSHTNTQQKGDKDELIQFEQLYRTNLFIQTQANQLLLKPNNNEDNSEPNKVIVTKTKWIPSHTLCKKCKVKDPYDKFKDNNNNSTSFNSIQKQCLKETNQYNQYKYTNYSHKPKEDELIQRENNEINTKLILDTQPDINLFDSIFN